MEEPVLNDVVIQSIICQADSLDDIIDIALTSSRINNLLKSTYMINVVQERFNIKRPVLDWSDLLRENSKIHATKYAKTSDVYDIYTDYPYVGQLVCNVLRENYLVDRYYSDVTISDYSCATDIDVIDRLFADLHTRSIQNITRKRIYINSKCKDQYNKFSIDIFRHYLDVIVPKYFSTPFIITTNSVHVEVVIDFHIVTHTIFKKDIPLNTIFQTIVRGDNKLYCTLPIITMSYYGYHMMRLDPVT